MSAPAPTEIERLKRALEASQRRMDALITATAEIVWCSEPDQQGGIAHGWEAFTGRNTGTERSGWLEAMHPDDIEAVVAEADRGVAGQTPYVTEYRLWHRTGRYKWVEDRAVPVFDLGGSLVEWVGVISDIDDRKIAEEALRGKEERLRLATMASGVGVWDVDLQTGARSWSAELTSMLGLPEAAEPSLKTFLDRIHPDDLALVDEAHNKTFMESESGSVTFRITRKDNGELRWLLSRGGAMFVDGKPVRRLGTMQDVTERRHLELELQNRQRRLNSALRAGRMVAWERDLGTDNEICSENARELLGVTTTRSDEFLSHVAAEDRSEAIWDDRVGPQQPVEIAQFRYQHPDGRQLWLETRAEVVADENGARRVAGVTADITARKIAEDALVRAANHDPFTGLLNRTAFGLLFEQALAEARAEGASLQLLFLDLDSLKTINDCFGHDAGDEIVAATGRCFGELCPPFRFAARLSGDEFAAVLRGHDHAETERLANTLIEVISQPVTHRGNSLSVSASVGLASFPTDGTQAGLLMKAADLALYEAKQLGKRQARWFRPEMRTALDQRTALKAQMVAALHAKQIVPYYQPKVVLATGEIVGFEALARWRHASGLLTPSVFGSLFED